mmetsp:Transcript_20363/g.52092  ORF Transcript_20363/g.52092 Transcript_20363/m.52092 type:complete len:212 (-) Transcript_20363:607-1242(-)
MTIGRGKRRCRAGILQAPCPRGCLAATRRRRPAPHGRWPSMTSQGRAGRLAGAPPGRLAHTMRRRSTTSSRPSMVVSEAWLRTLSLLATAGTNSRPPPRPGSPPRSWRPRPRAPRAPSEGGEARAAWAACPATSATGRTRRRDVRTLSRAGSSTQTPWPTSLAAPRPEARAAPPRPRRGSARRRRRCRSRATGDSGCQATARASSTPSPSG